MRSLKAGGQRWVLAICCPELPAQGRCAPGGGVGVGGAERDGPPSTADGALSVLSAWVFPAWPPLLVHPPPLQPSPSPVPPRALCMWSPLPVDSPLSGLSHATVSNHPAHPPLNPESRSPSPTSSPRWGGGGLGGGGGGGYLQNFVTS